MSTNYSLFLLLFVIAHFPCPLDAGQPIFIVPSNGASDFSQTYHDGDSVQIAWNADPYWDHGLVDLWVTWDIRDQDNFVQLLTSTHPTISRCKFQC